MSDAGPELSRRQWLRRLLPRAGGALAEAAERAIARRLPPRRRPPGAIAEPAFLAACTRCDRCAEACPEAAIFRLTAAAGVAAGTPVMVPDARPCAMCDGFPCAAACEDGALLPPPGRAWRLGRVRIDRARCIAHRGIDCGACAGLCPAGVRGLAMERWRPRVLPDCVGCGRCIAACPTDPKAIILEPLAEGAP